MFSQKLVDVLMENHFQERNIRVQVLMIMNNLTKTHPSVFEKYMDTLLSDKTVLPMEQHFVNGTLVNVSKNNMVRFIK